MSCTPELFSGLWWYFQVLHFLAIMAVIQAGIRFWNWLGSNGT